jgi:hypothetical protein
MGTQSFQLYFLEYWDKSCCSNNPLLLMWALVDVHVNLFTTTRSNGSHENHLQLLTNSLSVCIDTCRHTKQTPKWITITLYGYQYYCLTPDTSTVNTAGYWQSIVRHKLSG